jgi:hypothetical protein
MTDPLIAEIRRRAADASQATDMAARFPETGAAPLDERSISQAEAILGRALPPFLHEAYRSVGNGGFGPGYGLLPLLVVGEANDSESVVDLYRGLSSSDRDDPVWAWPSQLLPFCDWGCAIRSCVDCSSAEGAVVTFDPGVRGVSEPMSNAFVVTHASLRNWFADWIAGVKLWELMFEPDPSRATTGIDPFTKKPRSFVPMKLRRQ